MENNSKETVNTTSHKTDVIRWVAVTERRPLVDGDKQLFVWDGYKYEIARYNEWGFHYGTRNTQDCLHNVLFWAECPEPPCL